MVSGAMTEGRGRRWANRRALWLSLWLMVLVLAIKVWVGWATRSLSLLAAACHTLVLSYSLLLSAVAVSSPRAVNSDQWKHGRLESLLTFLLVGGLGFVSCLLAGFAGQRIGLLPGAFLPPSQINASLLQLLGGIAIVSLLIGLWGHFQSQSGENSIVRFNAHQILQDAGLMLLIVAGLIGVQFGLVWLDPLIMVGGLIITFVNAGRVINQQLPSMMQQVAIAPEALTKTVRQVEGILHCYNVRSQGMVGRRIYVELSLILHPECESVAQTIVQRVERLISHQYGPAKVVVHVDSDQPATKKVAVKNSSHPR